MTQRNPHALGALAGLTPIPDWTIHDVSVARVPDVACGPAPDDCISIDTTAHHILLPRTGVLHVTASGGKRAQVIDPAMALLVAAGVSVTVRPGVPGTHVVTVVTMPPALFAAMTGSASGARAHDPRAVVLSPSAMLHAERVRRLATSGSVCRSVVCELVQHLTDARDPAHVMVTPRARRTRGLPLADIVRTMLATNPGASHTLDGIAARIGISPFHLARVFRARTGYSIHQYLLHIRMARALDALGAGEASLSRLALDLGFCSHSHFATTFRRHFGVSPRSVRAMLHDVPAIEAPHAA